MPTITRRGVHVEATSDVDLRIVTAIADVLQSPSRVEVWPAIPCPCKLCNDSIAKTCYFVWQLDVNAPGGVYCEVHGLLK